MATMSHNLGIVTVTHSEAAELKCCKPRPFYLDFFESADGTGEPLPTDEASFLQLCNQVQSAVIGQEKEVEEENRHCSNTTCR